MSFERSLMSKYLSFLAFSSDSDLDSTSNEDLNNSDNNSNMAIIPLIIKELGKVPSAIADIKTLSEQGATIKSLNISYLDIPEGIYESSGNMYIKTTEKITYHYAASSDDKPDDDKGGSAIAITISSQENKNNARYSIIEWINNIENEDVRQYLLSLVVVRDMEQRLTE